MIVIDTSVAIKWVSAELSSEWALQLLELGETLVAPDLLLPEAASVLRKKARRSELLEAQVAPALSFLQAAISRFIPSAVLIEDAMALSSELDHSPFDCFFLACAVRVGTLVTADAVFQKKCLERGYGAAVVHLSSEAGRRFLEASIHGPVDAQAMEDVRRLAEYVAKTFDAVHDRYDASNDLGEVNVGFRSSEAFSPAFQSASYVRLKRVLAKLVPDEVQAITCLSWLGRPDHHPDQLSRLWRNAAQFSREGPERHLPYLTSIIRDAPEGLRKLRNSLNAYDH